ncbi:mucoidy inhibitor MuiA family protein [Mucilaginibacter sp. HC2]|uniref:mucoidy inhibitor MuiA family protein n=1 Tax=Mucilaginibacter inviolabilis TaxID=2714892 RepID=UPI00140B99E6|nr:mucoidy inhibitor MuiA family protein [Mucilaginibacter inviolabilis]NHA04686.1 mucoidy inhibitor MuiA family protein [Mucilaginibacter inviolabilis]
MVNKHQCFYGKMHSHASLVYPAGLMAGSGKLTDDMYLTESMMFKKLSTAAVLLFMAMASKADEGQKIASKVQKVTVFLNGAQVTRTALVSVSPGTSTLVFGNMSPGIDVQSLQVSAGGEFTILSVKQELDFLNEESKQKQLVDLQAQQKMIRDKISLQNNMLSIYQEEATMLGKNQVVTGVNASLDVLKLKQALDFQTARLTEIKRKQQTVNDQVDALNTELQKYDRQIADITKGSSKATSNVLVTVSSKSALQSTFTLNYVVQNASWYPTYDIRAKNVNSPISITYKANVSQQSGEDWRNIKITLSTGNPSISGNKPELTPNYLNLGMYYSGNAGPITKVTGKIFEAGTSNGLAGVSIRVKGTSIGATSDAQGFYSLQVPPNSPDLAFNYIGYEVVERPANMPLINVTMSPSTNNLSEVVVTGYGAEDKRRLVGALSGSVSGIRIRGAASIQSIPVEVKPIENQTNVEFNIANPYSIPSDGKQYAVEIGQFDLNASYQYFVAPKVSTDVFLTAQLTNWNKYNFLSGEANLFFEGTFIGKSLINTQATADTLNLSLGTDKNIVVTRTLQKDLTERQSFGSNKKETRNWLIEVKNRKNQPVSLLVEDQIPVSQNSAIEVEQQEISGAKLDALTGKLSWNFMLNSQDNKKIQLKYQVKYPKNQSVIVQ